jgi:hypothetical protein
MGCISFGQNRVQQQEACLPVVILAVFLMIDFNEIELARWEAPGIGRESATLFGEERFRRATPLRPPENGAVSAREK